MQDTMNKNPVSQLQLLMVSQKKVFPVYTFECSGSQPEMKFICTVKTSDVEAVGEGRSKKIAKALAADNALVQLGQNSTNIKNTDKKPLAKILLEEFSETSNYTGELHEFASIHGVGYPIYEMPYFCVNGNFRMICKFQGLESEGIGENKKKAKQIASYKMLENLNNNKLVLENLKSPKAEKIDVKNILNSSSKKQISIDLEIFSKGQVSSESLEKAFKLDSNSEPGIEA